MNATINDLLLQKLHCSK